MMMTTATHHCRQYPQEHLFASTTVNPEMVATNTYQPPSLPKVWKHPDWRYITNPAGQPTTQLPAVFTKANSGCQFLIDMGTKAHSQVLSVIPTDQKIMQASKLIVTLGSWDYNMCFAGFFIVHMNHWS